MCVSHHRTVYRSVLMKLSSHESSGQVDRSPSWSKLTRWAKGWNAGILDHPAGSTLALVVVGDAADSNRMSHTWAFQPPEVHKLLAGAPAAQNSFL